MKHIFRFLFIFYFGSLLLAGCSSSKRASTSIDSAANDAVDSLDSTAAAAVDSVDSIKK